MRATNYDILDLVLVMVNNLPGKTPDVRLAGHNILIGNKPVSIADIKAAKHNTREFVEFIGAAM